MANKQKVLTVSNCFCEADRNRLDGKRTGYAVQKVVNSLEFHVGQVLSKAEVQELCDARDWTVNVVPSK